MGGRILCGNVPATVMRVLTDRSVLQLRPHSLRCSNRRLASEGLANVGRGLPIQLATILQERHGRGGRVRCSQGHHLEGPIAVANDAQQGLRVGRVGITDNGNLPRLREGIGQRLEPLPKAQRILSCHGLHLRQSLMSDVDMT